MSTLYELTEQFQILYDMADDPSIDEQTWLDTMEALDGEIEAKAEGYAAVMAQNTSDINGLDVEIKRLTAKKKSKENANDRMKKTLQMSMQATGKTKFTSGNWSFNIQKNPASVVLDSEDIPEMFLIPQEPKVDKTAIKEALKTGIMFDFAHLEQSESLRIK